MTETRLKTLVRMSIAVPFLVVLITGMLPILNAIFDKKLELGNKAYFSLLLMLASASTTYMMVRLESLKRVSDKLGGSHLIGRVREIGSTMELASTMRDLAVGSTFVHALNLSDPKDHDGHLRNYFDFLHGYLTTDGCPIEEYRRIANIGSRQKCKWTFSNVGRFCSCKRVSHVHFDLDSAQMPWMSFVVFERPSGIHALLFRPISGGARVDAVLVHDDLVGKFFLSQFDYLWRVLTERKEAILENGQLNEDKLQALAEHFQLVGSSAYRDLASQYSSLTDSTVTGIVRS